MSRGRILVVDDEKDIRFLISEILTDDGYAVAEAPHSEAAFAEIAKAAPDLVILDIWLENSDRDGMEILAELKKTQPQIPVLMISGHGNIEMAVKAIKLGAYDFIEKPFNTDRLLHLVNRAVESSRLRRGAPLGNVSLVSTTPEMQAVQKAAQKAAHGDARVMISGPWGSGRTHLARWIHQESARASKPFITMTATDPLNDMLALAGEGTLLVREVQNLPADAQAALLAKLNGKMDARVIATASPDVKAKILPDLYGRLSVASIVLPPLEERRGDIADLVIAFMGEGYTLADDASVILKRRNWAGQLAELKALCAMASVRMALAGDLEFRASHIGVDAPQEASAAGTPQEEWLGSDLRTARESFERWYFENLMERFDGNVSKVADFAGMDRTALHRKLKALKDGEGERLAS